MKKIYLIADIGGTNIRLALVIDNNITNLQIYKAHEYKNILDVISLYLNNFAKNFKVKDGIIAIAATILSDTITMTNINWQFSINNLKEKLNFNSLRVINDFEAQALCIEHLKLNDTTLICKSSSNISNNRRVILGPGTGLGVSLLVKIDEVWQVIPAEAGHTVIGFYNNLEQQILSYITNQLNCEPYAEKLISGNGIVNIYNALLYINKLPIKNNITAQDIYNLVLQNNSIALQSIDLFFNFLGTFVGNCIVSYLPYDGVYLTGGVLPKLLPYFMKSNFANRLQNKNLPTIQNIINNTAVHLITAENPALIGLKSLCLK